MQQETVKAIFFVLGTCGCISFLSAQKPSQNFVAGVVDRAQCPLVKVDLVKRQFEQTPFKVPVGTSVMYRPMAGTKLFGRSFSSASDRILLFDKKKNKSLYVGNMNCLFAKASLKLSPTPPAGITFTETYGAIRDSLAWKAKPQVEASLSLQTYKTSSTVSTPFDSRATLNVQILGLLPEYSWRWKRASSEWGFAVGGFYGAAEIGRSLAELQSLAVEGFNYQVSNLKVYGVETSLFYMMRPAFKNVAIGFKLPFRWMKTAWPIPAAGYSIKPQTSFTLSYLLEARLERAPFTWFQNIGFYNSWGSVLWSLGFSYQL